MSQSSDSKAELPAAIATTDAAASGAWRPRVEVKKLHAVSLWSWDIEVDTCAICRNLIMEPCIECQASQRAAGSECSVAFGACNHPFHFHCISRWLRTRSVCPLDNEEWNFMRTASTV